MDTQLHEHNKGRWVVHVKEVKCVLCELWLLKLKRFSLVYLFFFLNILFNSCSVNHDTLFLMDTQYMAVIVCIMNYIITIHFLSFHAFCLDMQGIESLITGCKWTGFNSRITIYCPRVFCHISLIQGKMTLLATIVTEQVQCLEVCIYEGLLVIPECRLFYKCQGRQHQLQRSITRKTSGIFCLQLPDIFIL